MYYFIMLRHFIFNSRYFTKDNDDMSPIVEMLKLRYIKPLEALKEDALGKTLISTVGVALATGANIFTTLQEMFNTPIELILLLILAIVGDWITGISKSKRKGSYISSLGLRQQWVKVLEYGVGLAILTGIANVFGTADINGWVGTLVGYCKNIHWAGYLYATFTELKSIAENFKGKEGRISKIVQEIDEKIFGEGGSP